MKIFVPVDGSKLALDAVRHALHLRREGLQASDVLATLQDPTYLYERVLAPDAHVLERVTGAVGARALEGAEALFKAATVPYEREIASGFAAITCDAIVMGARGMGTVRSGLPSRHRRRFCMRPSCPSRSSSKHAEADLAG